MYNIGDLIIYGNNGVCKVVDTTTLQGSGASGISDRKCYILQPLHDETCRITTPVDNQKVIMRSLLSREETEELIREIPSIEMLPEHGVRQQEAEYQKALRSGNCREWISLIKTLNARISRRKMKGKRITVTDDRYFKAASEKLVEEFSVVLNLDQDSTEKLLKSAFSETE